VEEVWLADADRQPWRVRIRGSRGVVGAGFLVDRRHVVTCAHVIADALGQAMSDERPDMAVQVDFPEVPKVGGILATVLLDGWLPISTNQSGDVAVLELQAEVPEDVIIAPLRQPPSVRGHPFRTYGFPRGVDLGVWAEGRLSGPGGPRGEWIQLEGVRITGRRVERGFSGAAVYDDLTGGVVGMIVADDKIAEAKVAWMIPIQVLVMAWPPLERLIPSRLHLDPEFRRHWEPRGRGVERHVRPGWYFTGRTRVLGELVAWMTAPSGNDPRARIVTGGPGSGKSAVLARLVTLADPQYRLLVPLADADPATIPPPGCVDVAVHAARKTTEQVIAAMAEAVGLQPGSPEDLVDELLDRNEPLMIVVDALDEAFEPKTLARRLLRPLTTDGGRVGIRLVVGTRRNLVGLLGANATALDLDDPAYLERADLSFYVRRLLLAEGQPDSRTPYRTQAGVVDRVANAVAERAYPTFLVAQLVGRSLAEASAPVDLNQPNWANRFPASVDDAMDDYLARFGEEERRATELLLPLAYAEGTGLARDELWAKLASTLGSRRYDVQDVSWLLDTAAAYLVETTEMSGRIAFRLFHQALIDYLQTKRSEAHQTYTSVLIDTVPRLSGSSRKDWLAAHPYVRTHLGSHAANAGRLDELLDDVGFLVAADPSRLLRALASTGSAGAVQATRIYRQAAPQLRRKPVPERASYLELYAHQAGYDQLAERIANLELDRPWSTRWVRWRAVHAHQIVGRHSDPIAAVAIGELDSRPVAVSASQDGTVRVWDLERCLPVGEPLRGHEDVVNAVSMGELDGRPIAVSGSNDATLRVWDLERGAQIGQPLHGHEGWIAGVAFGDIDGSPIAVSASEDQTLRVWDLRSGVQLGEPLRGHRSQIYAVAVDTSSGRPMAVSGGGDGLIYIWDLKRGKQLGEPLRGHEAVVTAVSIGKVNNHLMVVSTSGDSTVRIWDLEDRSLYGEPLRGHGGWVAGIAIGELDGHAVAVSSGEDQTLRVWDLVNGVALGEPLRGHQAEVDAVAVGELDSHPIVVSGSEDRTVRVWNLERGAPLGEPLQGHEDAVTAVATGYVHGHPVAISGGQDLTLRLWDLATGAALKEPLRGHKKMIAAIAIGELSGTPVAISASDDATLRVWNLDLGESIGEPLRGHSGWVAGVAITDLGGNLVAVSGGDRTVRVWDLEGGRQLGIPMYGHDAVVTTVSTGNLGGRPVAVSGSEDATVRMWDLAIHAPLGEPLRGHGDWVRDVAIGTIDGEPIAVSASDDRTVRVWDLTRGAPLGKPLRGHDGWVRAVAVAEVDGRPIAVSAGDDATVRVWSLTEFRETVVIESASDARAIAINSDGIIVIGTIMGVIALQLPIRD
jgi:WD40 repeat protein